MTRFRWLPAILALFLMAGASWGQKVLTPKAAATENALPYYYQLPQVLFPPQADTPQCRANGASEACRTRGDEAADDSLAEACEDSCEAGCDATWIPIMVADCLKMWAILWELGSYQEAGTMADEACRLDPTNIAAEHARALSQMVNTSGSPAVCCPHSECSAPCGARTCQQHAVSCSGQGCPISCRPAQAPGGGAGTTASCGSVWVRGTCCAAAAACCPPAKPQPSACYKGSCPCTPAQPQAAACCPECSKDCSACSKCKASSCSSAGCEKCIACPTCKKKGCCEECSSCAAEGACGSVCHGCAKSCCASKCCCAKKTCGCGADCACAKGSCACGAKCACGKSTCACGAKCACGKSSCACGANCACGKKRINGDFLRILQNLSQPHPLVICQPMPGMPGMAPALPPMAGMAMPGMPMPPGHPMMGMYHPGMPMPCPGMMMPPMPGMPRTAEMLNAPQPIQQYFPCSRGPQITADRNGPGDLGSCPANEVCSPPPAPEMPIQVTASGKRIQVLTPRIEAVCDRLTYLDANDCVLLEGAVRLTFRKGGAGKVQAERVAIGVHDGSIEVNPEPAHEPMGPTTMMPIYREVLPAPRPIKAIQPASYSMPSSCPIEGDNLCR